MKRANINGSSRVRVAALQPHSLAFGGFEMQMINAMEAARSFGVDIQPLDYWSRNDEFEILHVWGLSVQHFELIKWARKARKKIILTALTGYRDLPGLIQVFKVILTQRYLFLWRMLREVDRIVVVNSGQARYLSSFYGLSVSDISIIPNLVSPAFTAVDGSLNDRSSLLSPPYFITVGNICLRKNQLELSKIFHSLKIRLLVVGSSVPGEEGYFESFQRFARNSPYIEAVGALEQGSEQLVRLYKGAAGFILLSHSEQQPISALEALSCGVPLILANRSYARQHPFEAAILVDPNNCDHISAAVHEVLNSKPKTPDNHDMSEFSGSNIGQLYCSLYKERS